MYFFIDEKWWSWKRNSHSPTYCNLMAVLVWSLASAEEQGKPSGTEIQIIYRERRRGHRHSYRYKEVFRLLSYLEVEKNVVLGNTAIEVQRVFKSLAKLERAELPGYQSS